MVMALILGVGAMAMPAGPARADGPTWIIQTLDADEITSTSLALDSHDNPHISYCTGGLDSLRYTQWVGTAWAKETVDDGPVFITSMALDSMGFPHICYSTLGGASLHYAHWTGAAWAKEVVTDSDIRDCSLAVDSNNRPCISYILGVSGFLQYTRWIGTIWVTETVDDTDVFSSTSLALDSQNHAHISYGTSGLLSLHYAHWTGTAWAKQVVDDVNVSCTSIALDSSGYPHIAYASIAGVPGSLHYAWLTAAGWLKGIVDPVNVFDCDIALDSHNFPHISYYASTGGLFDGGSHTVTGMLKYAHWTGGAWDVQTVDQETATLGGLNHTQQGGFIGLFIGGSKWSSIAVDSNDIPHITYGSLIPTVIIKSLHYAQLNQPVNVVEQTGSQTTTLRRSFTPPPPPTGPTQYNQANISLQYLNINPQQTTANQPVTISTNVVNTGDQAGNYQVALKINGELVENRMVSVGPQAVQPVKFTVSRAKPGTYNIDILDKSGSFTVLGASAATGSKAGGMIVLALIAILLIGTVVVLLLRFT
jgi:hypothetical protein